MKATLNFTAEEYDELSREAAEENQTIEEYINSILKCYCLFKVLNDLRDKKITGKEALRLIT